MTRTTSCTFCASTRVPAELECIRMCDDCINSHVDLLVDGHSQLWALIVKGFLRRRRRILEGAR